MRLRAHQPHPPGQPEPLGQRRQPRPLRPLADDEQGRTPAAGAAPRWSGGGACARSARRPRSASARSSPSAARAASRSSGRNSCRIDAVAQHRDLSAVAPSRSSAVAQPGADGDHARRRAPPRPGSAAAAPDSRETASRPSRARSAPPAGRIPRPAAPRRRRRDRGNGRRWRRTARPRPAAGAARAGSPGAAATARATCPKRGNDRIARMVDRQPVPQLPRRHPREGRPAAEQRRPAGENGTGASTVLVASPVATRWRSRFSTKMP